MNEEIATELLNKYHAGTCTAAEKAAVEAWYNFEGSNAERQVVAEDMELRKDLIWNNINSNTVKVVKFGIWKYLGAAAAVIGIAVCVYLFTTLRHPDIPLSSRANAKDLNDIAPGGNRAILTANGNTINLSENKTGIIVGDDIKYTDGTDIAPLSSRANAKDLSMQTLTTPKGGMYSIILQDGTKVWLNADSKLEFFSNYRNKLQRIVKLLAGEAYLEVAKDSKRPFIVESKGQRVTVLGTHFNISAYNDDVGIRTTLLEGSVRVASLSSRANAKDLDPSGVGMTSGGGMTKRRDGEAVTLKPGQQSTVTNNQPITVKEVDVTTITAWKNNEFMFTGEPIENIMKMVARWYNVDIKYQGAKPTEKYSGGVSRFDNVSKVLEILESSGGVHFKITGRTIYVTK